MRLLEHYVSTQGEGPRVGIPTQFIRFAGCNLRCPGWPCDTEFAIEPTLWRNEVKYVSHIDILTQVEIKALTNGAKNLCFTGGEPLLQEKPELLNLARKAVTTLGCTVEMFTNGSRLIPMRLAAWCTFVMDWKLPGSGEKFTADYECNRVENLELMANPPASLGVRNSVKFVCKNQQDLAEARRVYQEHKLADWNGDVYFGVVWDGKLTPAQLVEDLLRNPPGPWKLNLQTHQYIWDPNERRR